MPFEIHLRIHLRERGSADVIVGRSGRCESTGRAWRHKGGRGEVSWTRINESCYRLRFSERDGRVVVTAWHAAISITHEMI